MQVEQQRAGRVAQAWHSIPTQAAEDIIDDLEREVMSADSALLCALREVYSDGAYAAAKDGALQLFLLLRHRAALAATPLPEPQRDARPWR